MPVIHSNLSAQSLPSAERRGSEFATTAVVPPPKPQHNYGSRIASASQPLVKGKLFAQLAVNTTTESKRYRRLKPTRTTPTPSFEETGSYFSGFSFLSRKKGSNAAQVEKNEKEMKTLRNGVVAGTGHQGYGQIGAAKRRSGSISNMTRNPFASQTAQEPRSSNDPFSAYRMSPEAIARGAIMENRNAVSKISQSVSSQSLATEESSLGNSHPLVASQDQFRHTPFPSPPAFHAMMDLPEQEGSEPMDIRIVSRFAEIYGKSPSVGGTSELLLSPTSSSVRPAEQAQPVRRGSVEGETKPRLPVLQQTLMSKNPTLQPPSTSITAIRRSRLPQVGRIPKVMSHHTEHMSPTSFSRPFRAGMLLALENLEVYDPESIAKRPSPSRPSTPVPDLTTDSSTLGSTDNLSSRPSYPPALIGAEQEFLAFSPRKDSKGTIGTSCSSCSGFLAFSGSTPVIPQPYDPPAEDEVRGEYDDLIEDAGKAPSTATSSRGAPFHLETQAATFFNLSPRAPLPEELKSSSSSFPLSPPNHQQIQYVSHLDKFPFAPQSFTAVVYRFPVAAPEAYYCSILTEARRVLEPGGFIELCILDVDLNNMGNRGRRTVRRLKERINEKTPDTSLGSTADLIVRLLGKVGFTTIKAARVGVPVATSVTRSDSKADKGKAIAEKKKDPPSLSEMMSDNSPLADEGITKMVSRVGRWWYTRCYESAAGNSSVKSIWGDKCLLSEAEELGTSLKLMVCCARAPLERITSV
ncbi:hypothetical protein FGLOB1_10792 [Fusarium globosum]|uniref:Methyltransferase type 11 domain-containing protein n=1 Tax=Fusarium globosum TaxID=78864 RepID=A0A8H5XV74_9HYPO|nr:hypothetical protein FGLOB1_10792 [Fusarium globosum]